jgi:hypothetical protein
MMNDIFFYIFFGLYLGGYGTCFEAYLEGFGTFLRHI